MSVNSSSNSSLHSSPAGCLTFRETFSVYTGLIVTDTLLLLPLFILVLYVGHQRWRKQRSVATAAMMSHSDVFTFNMVVLELIGVLGSCSYYYGTYINQQSAKIVGEYMFSIISPGQILFHLLTCVERYLAVAHPITYLRLRQSGGVRIRNISIVCVWLFCFGSLGSSKLNVKFNVIYSYSLLTFSCIVVSFCSLSVLCVLIRPGPGEVGGNRERADPSKQRAFYTIMVIMVALLLKFLISLVSTVMHSAPMLSHRDLCLLVLSVSWSSVPSSLVLPLLFLRRAGKLPGCKHNTVSA